LIRVWIEKKKINKKNKKNEDQIRKIKHHKHGLKDEIEKYQNFNKRAKEKKIEIKRRKIKLKILICDKLGLKN
jgi:uncharacterized protein YlxW (UPF0749 family)